ncbi:hypothetical protein BZL41_17020 [Pseudomonas sp. PIC25]|uniref:hypothetical protein n=1 Tax=Pseudomonas sp. PIC25 TaxID=1958773 RepID=UPI000BAB6BD3|nr:hypothetical protein [Pseudomonas sp. PIC25]PAU59202.1 hypothetical protein BZL41_17020 [Pseudomonas sp. PIC25]
MTTRCLICNSSVVLSKDAAIAIARLIGTLDGFLHGIQQSATKPQTVAPDVRCERPLEHAFNLMIDGIAGAASSWPDIDDFIRDIRRHQFMEFDCLCLRCGAKYDEKPLS